MKSIFSTSNKFVPRKDDLTRRINPQLNSPLFRLPVELRLAIYGHVIAPTKTRTLYITRDIWAWNRHDGTRKFLDILLVCRHMYDEALDVLYERHELPLYTHRTWEPRSRDLVRFRLCGIEDYSYVLQRVPRMRLTLFVAGDTKQDDVLIALLAWLRTVLAERRKPMKMLTLEFCAMGWKLDKKPTAILYAAQKFRSLGPTTLSFQCGFSGVGTESAMEALMQHANEKNAGPTLELGKEEAFENFLRACKKSRSQGYISKLASQSWFKTTPESA